MNSGAKQPVASLDATRSARPPRDKALLVLWLLIALYVANFGALSILQNAAFETSAADLGNMNQAVWYTLHRGYPADSYAGQVITRFGGHVEPIFYLLALPYALNQSADMLLIIQTIAIALGALAVYMLARDIFASEPAGLAFALAYLLFPSLQAANLTEFHPVALAAPLFLFAFYYLQKGSSAPFLVFAILAMITKEDMSLLVVMLGLFVLVAPRLRVLAPLCLPLSRSQWAGLLACVIGLSWFLIAVYGIIPHFSASGEHVLFERYTEVGGSPQGLVRTMLSDPLAVLARLLAPEKLSYLAGLLLSAGFLTLAAPWALVLAAPSLGINMLSNYAPMYSGLSHYSAPVVPFIIIGAIYGARSLSGFLQRRLRVPGQRALLVVLGWLLVVVTVYQAMVGFTPLSMLYRVPRVTAHNQLLARFTRQVPSHAVVSAQAPLHPHLSSRALIYPFPTINDAEYVLVDVTARPTMHPNDLKSGVQKLISDGFGVLDAADGYILLQRGVARADLPESFYSAFRVTLPSPQYHVVADFGPSLRLLGYDIEDVDEGRQPWTRVRLYWQVIGSLPDDLHIYPFYLDDAGRVIEDTTQRPLVGMLWYPPASWQVGDIIRLETLPWPLGDRFRLALGVVQGMDWGNQAARLRVHLVDMGSPVRALDGGTVIELARFERKLTTLSQVQPPVPQPGTRLEATFGAEIKLLGYDVQGKIVPGETVRLTLYWRALTRPAVDYHTFAHIYDGAGQVAAQSDALTGDEQPTTWWFPGQVITETRTIAVPPTAPSTLSPFVTVGLYRLDTGARLPVTTGKGQPQGDTVRIQP